MAERNQDDTAHIDSDEDEGVISQEDCWSVIQSYFDENVLLSENDSSSV